MRCFRLPLIISDSSSATQPGRRADRCICFHRNCPQFRALAPRLRSWERRAISCRVAVADAIAMRLREGVEVRPTLIDETFAVRANRLGAALGQRPA